MKRGFNHGKIIKTLSTYPGKKVIKVFEIICAYDDGFRMIRNRWNSDIHIQKAMDLLYEKGIALGANAVLGVQISHLETGIPFVMGTPVIFEDE